MNSSPSPRLPLHPIAKSLSRFFSPLLLLPVLLSAPSAFAQTDLGGTFLFTTGPFEAAETQGSVLVSVTRTNIGQVYGKMLVDVIVSDGTATNGVDFEVPQLTNTLVFSNFQTVASISIPIIDNTVATNGPSKNFNLNLANPRPAPDEVMGFTATIGEPASTQVTIYDNDETNSFNLESKSYVISEGGSTRIFVVLSQPVPDNAQGVSVDYSILVDPAIPLTAGSDYANDANDFVVASGTISFAPGDTRQPIDVSSLADNIIEFNEDFHVKLSNPQGTIPPPDTGGTDGGTDGSTDGGTDGATDGGTTGGGGAPAEEARYVLGQITSATVTILFNGASDHIQPAGSLDQLFNEDNSADTFPPYNPLPGANRTVYSAVTDFAGRTIIGGEFTSYNGTPRNRIARVMTNGLLDTAFAPNGGANDFVAAVLVYQSGPDAEKVLVAGGFTAVNGAQRNSIARLNANGSLDTSFQPGQGANGPIYAVVLEGNGNIIIGGDFTSFDGVQRNNIARLLPNGQLDLTFDPGSGPNGAVLTILSEVPPAFSLSMTNDGTGPATDTVTINTGATSGMIDFTYNFFSSPDELVIYQGTTQIFTTGLTNNEVVVTNADDTLTTNFVPRTVRIPYNGAAMNLSFVIDEGSTNTPADWDIIGTVFPNLTLGIVVGGEFTEFNGVPHGRIARLTSNGGVDLNFSSNIGLGADGSINALGFLPNEKTILAAGSFNSFNSLPYRNLIKLHGDGVVDRDFLRASGPNDTVWALTIAPNDPQNRFYIGGRFNSVHDTHRLSLARLFDNGAVDTSFLDTAYNNYAGLPDPNGLFPNNEVQTITLDPNGDVLIGGTFTRVGGGGGASRENFRPRWNFARLVGGETVGPGNIQWSDVFFGGDEASGILAATLVRTNGWLGNASMSIFTIEGSATADVDYADISGFPVDWGYTNIFRSNGSNNPIALLIPIFDDKEIEGDETFLIENFAPHGYLDLGGARINTGVAYGPPRRTRAQIIEDDTNPSVISFELSEYEGDEDGGLVTINVHRTGNVSGSVSARYTVVSPTNANAATAGEDYIAATGSITFVGGQTNKSFTVRILDDELVEFDELIALRLSSPTSGAQLGANTNVLLTIVDNDYAPGRVSFSASEYTVDEGGNAIVTIQRRGGNVGVLRVDYRTENETAFAPADFTHVNGTLLWNHLDSSPRTVVIPIGEDGFVEGIERFRILLSNASPVEAIGSRSNSVVNIEDNDFFGSFSFNAEEYLADEIGTNVIINVTRRGGSAETASVNYSTTALTAVPGEHYHNVSGTLVFGVGEVSKSFVIPILDDAVTNGERRVEIILSNPQPAGAGLLAPTNAVLSIIDNETFNIPAGSVETDFGLGGGANDTVNEILLQQDGKIIVVGEFTAFNNELRPFMARLLRDGSLDRTFEPDFTIDGPMTEAIFQSDGKILVAGSFTTINNLPSRFIARFTRAGDPDSTFNPGSGADNPIYALAETSVNGERRLLVGGNFTVMNGIARRGIARLLENGRTDLTFDPGSGVNGVVFAMAVQRDGSILIAGDFAAVNGEPRINIARLHPNGSVDTAFNTGGVDGPIRALAISLDDKVIIAGDFNSVSGVERHGVARLNFDGTLDTSLDAGTGPNGPIFSIELQRDAKILLGGDFTTFQGLPANRIIRLNSDGSVDPTANFGRGANSFVTSIAVQPDRRILIGGDFTTVDGYPRRHLARLYGGSIAGPGELKFEISDFTVNENGTNAVITVRRINGLTGNVTVDFATTAGTADAGSDYANVSGTLVFTSGENIQSFLVPILNDTIAEAPETIALSLSNATGGAVLDRQPVATLTILSDDSVVSFSQASYAVSEGTPGGRIAIQVVREGATGFPAVVNYSALPGTADDSDFDRIQPPVPLTFAPGETLKIFTVNIIDDTIVELNETVNLALTAAPDSGTEILRGIATLTIIDNDFAPGFLNLVPPAPVNESAGNVSITVSRTSGRTGAVSVNYSVVGGNATPGEDYIPVSGTLNFADGDTARTINIPILDDAMVEGNEFFTVRIQGATGGALIGPSDVVSVQIADDDFGPGSRDDTFNVGSGVNGVVRDIYLQPDGKILIAGAFTSFNGSFNQNLARVLPTGDRDAGFSSGQGTDLPVNAISLAPEGKVVVGGEFNRFGTISRRFVGRFLTNGFNDVTFTLNASENSPVRAVAVQADGKVIIGGGFTTPAKGLIRLNSNGSLDVSFNPDGGVEGVVLDIALQPNGSAVIGGNFTRVGNTMVRSIARVFSNGLLDTSFQAGTGANGIVRDVDVLPGGAILIAGDFSSYNGNPRNKVALLNSNGTLDLAFNPVSINGTVNAATRFGDKVYIAGTFTQVGGVTRTRIARLNSDGTLDTSFDAGIGPDDEVLDLEIQPDGQILIAGAFSSVNGFFSPGLARLNGDQQPVAEVSLQDVQFANGRISFGFGTDAGRTYVIEGSADLMNWELVDTRTGTGSVVQFTDNSAPAGQHRFYRVRVVTQ